MSPVLLLLLLFPPLCLLFSFSRGIFFTRTSGNPNCQHYLSLQKKTKHTVYKLSAARIRSRAHHAIECCEREQVKPREDIFLPLPKSVTHWLAATSKAIDIICLQASAYAAEESRRRRGAPESALFAPSFLKLLPR